MGYSDLVNLMEVDSEKRDALNLKLSCYRFAHFQASGAEWGSDMESRKNSNQLYYVLDGDPIVSQGGNDWRLLPGRVYLLPGSALSSHRCESRVVKYYCLFRLQLYPGRDLLESLTCPVIDLGEWNAEEIGYFDSVKGEPFSFESYTLLTGLILVRLYRMKPELQRLVEVQKKVHRRYGGLLALIDERLAADLKINELAVAMGRSASSLSRAFSRDFGLPLKDYLMQQLNVRVCELLETTGVSSKDIAEKYRFADASYFTSFFKKHNGVTPRRYRVLKG